MRYINKINSCSALVGLYSGSRGLQLTVISKEGIRATGNFIRYSILLARIDKFVVKSLL
jgi:hypothetical protein